LKSNTKIIADIVFMTATLHHCRVTEFQGDPRIGGLMDRNPIAILYASMSMYDKQSTDLVTFLMHTLHSANWPVSLLRIRADLGVGVCWPLRGLNETKQGFKFLHVKYKYCEQERNTWRTLVAEVPGGHLPILPIVVWAPGL